VPPRNRIDRQGLRALAREGLHLGGVAGVRKGWPLLSSRTWRLWLHLRRWRRNGGIGTPWILDLGDHREISGIPVTPSANFKVNQSVFETSLRIKGVFCLATHYWELPARSKHSDHPTVGDHLKYFVDRARSDCRVRWRSVGEIVSECTVKI
jgi:hypothetical protein